MRRDTKKEERSKDDYDYFFKGIIAGIGGVAPGLRGSVLLFSKVIDFFLNHYEMPTRFCFLGLILGTVPLFYKEVKKNGFSRKYYVVIVLAAALGFWMFTVNPNAFEQISNPTLLQSVLLGVAVAATAIIPGVDPAVLLSSLGYYEVYVSSLANFDLQVLLPMLIGLAAGAVGISFGMSILFRRFYTATFSVVFCIFLSMIPNMLNESCRLGMIQSAHGRFTAAVICLLLSGICDAFDGTVIVFLYTVCMR